MPTTLTMPALSPSMQEGTLARWLVGEGDEIAAGDVIAEIETDKATMEFEAPRSGVVARILVPAGSGAVAVATAIAVLAENRAEAAAMAAGTAAEAGPASAPGPAVSAASAPAAVIQPARGARVAASPLARRIAAIKGVELAMLSGSGPQGRIVRRDVEAATLAATAAPAPVPAPVAPIADAPAPAAAVEPAAVEALYRPGSYDVVKLDAMRRAIARRLTESKRTVPHFYLRADVELDALMALRAQVNAAAPVRDGGAPAWRISVNDMVIKALASALRDVPDANVTWAGDSILRHRTVDVAVAVAIEGGLITPIIRNAAAKSLSAISGEMKDLAARARARRLAPEEYQGGSTSVSNLGMYGVVSFDAVINPPHGTILAVGAAGRRPFARGDQLAVATAMTVTLSVDHRAVDGALGAELLDAFKRYAENPLMLLA